MIEIVKNEENKSTSYQPDTLVMETKIIPACLPKSSITIRLTPKDMATALLKFTPDEFKALRQELSEQSFYLSIEHIEECINILTNTHE